MITRLLGVPQTFHRNDWNTWTPFNKNFGSWTGLNLNASPVSFEVVRKVYHRFLLLWPISFKLVLVGFACIQNSRSQLNSSPILPCDANGKDCIQLEPFVALFWVKIEKKQRIVAMYCVPRKGLEREKRKRKFHKAKPPRAHVKETLHFMTWSIWKFPQPIKLLVQQPWTEPLNGGATNTSLHHRPLQSNSLIKILRVLLTHAHRDTISNPETYAFRSHWVSRLNLSTVAGYPTIQELYI